MIKNPFCRPRLRPSTAAATRKSDGFSPMSLLDRLREAVFRLIMISALSKGSNPAARRGRSSAEPPSSDHYYYPNDHHHSEAVADCIEFIKKSTTTADDETHHSTAGGYVDAAVVPLPVI